jgi:hypothetical protein
MGRRVSSQGELAPFLDRFVGHIASILPPKGRLAWISPQPARTRARLVEAGFDVTRSDKVSMTGAREEGFFAEIQTAVRRGGAMPRS